MSSTASECAFVSISPDGSAILYGLKPPDDYAQVWKYESAGDRHIRLTDDGGDNPAWSPDGTRIVYTRTAKGDGGVVDHECRRQRQAEADEAVDIVAYLQINFTLFRSLPARHFRFRWAGGESR